ncbi:MAG: PSD1 and planctomycete cytochrome C domain-containing protein [Planctomycetota bacterium]
MIHRRATRSALCCVMVACAACLVVRVARAAEADATKLPPAANREVDFVRDVRPIFQRACVRCHGPDKQKSEFRLDVRQTALTGGESYAPNIVPGKSADSPLVKMVAGVGDVTMPPEGDRLSAEEIGLLRAWIDQGAKWPDDVAGELKDKSDWWAFKPLATKAESKTGATSSPPSALPPPPSIDAFIRAKLDSVGLRPAPQADRRTLLRRIYFDLVGLPPTPEEAEAFVADPDPKAYEKLVDKLLESPHYGERWARHWLDAAHFAETHGHDQDRIRENAWPYRDYLILSLNADKPYARFVQEQVAGDVLFPDDPQATMALGFLAAGPWDESSLQSIREETLDRQIARYLDRDDMIANVINNFSSLTVQCARCHDHKFDPISQADYYSLQAVFSGVERANRRYDSDPAVQRRRIELQRRKVELEKPSAETTASLLSAESQRAVTEWEGQLATRAVVWRVLDPTEFLSSDGATLTKQPDGSILAGGTRPEKDTVTITAVAPLAKVTAIRLEVLTDDSLPQRGPGRQDNGNLHLSEFEVFREGSTAPVEIARATADFDQSGWEITKAIDKTEPTAWGIHPKVGQSHVAVFELKAPLSAAEGGEGTKPLALKFALKQLHGRQHLIGRMRLSVTEAAPPVRLDVVPERIAALLATPREQRSEAQRVELTAFQQLEEVERELASLPQPTMIYAAAADFEPDGGLRPPPGPRPIHVLHRGDIRHPREAALPGALACVKELPSRFELSNTTNEAVRRAALAKWLTDTQNSLTWRSIVNRVWHHHFGRGLVGTLNDFGHMGETPSHPELLDWLAVEFRDGGQSLKQLHRRIVLSETYRQSAELGARSAERKDQPPDSNSSTPRSEFRVPSLIDADNRLLWRMNRTRLDAECVRDAVVAVSGRLDLRMGGPSDRQFDLQPGIHVTPKIDYAKFDLNSDLGRRRSVYRFLFRTLPDPFMETLDCPSGDQITPARTTSVTVQQALALWNDAFIARHCEFIAARIEKEILSRQPISRQPSAEESFSSVNAQIQQAVRLILCRPATDPELRDLSEYASKHGLANVCRLLLNSNEFLFVN